MKTNLKLGLILLMFALSAPFAFGATVDTLTYGGYRDGFNDGHYYVGLATGTLASNPRAPFEMWCIYSIIPMKLNPFPVTVYDGLDDSDLVNSQLGFSSIQLKAMAILGSQFNHSASDKAGQYAIWNIGDPAHYPLNSAEQSLQDAAFASVGNYTYGNIRVYEPLGVTNQPFMSGSVAPVPEPTVPLLTGVGLVAISILARRRKAKNV